MDWVENLRERFSQMEMMKLKLQELKLNEVYRKYPKNFREGSEKKR